ncbi:DUF1674 domain-containing protein [Acetobacteraceae bacterium KSS8]|uniref:DUF1674 domain-containing protein n=1 Tax=Endosaccharibacter trunci TaxID=2812733 RepID=A0ABT1W223_9PROT|nr:DUF1674 domain-containing protein [Acetobacteraceae bacterium KSS8]
MDKDQTDPTQPDPAGTALEQPEEKEIGGPKENQPTRYGDWTVKGRCIDF